MPKSISLGRIALALTAFTTLGAVTANSAGQNRAKPARAKTPLKTVAPTNPAGLSPQSLAFLKTNCAGCHNPKNKQGDLDLSALKLSPESEKNASVWAKIHDRVRSGEMPPPEMGPIPAAKKDAFLAAIAAPLIEADTVRTRRDGRATWRRMNRYEYENALRDLLKTPWLQVKEMLPEDGEREHFNKVGDALDVSYVELGRYLAAAEYALRESMAQAATRPETTTRRFWAREQSGFFGHVAFGVFNGAPERATFPLLGSEADVDVLDQKAPMTVGDKDPKKRAIEGMGVVASTYEPLEIRFNRFRAPVSGRYKIRIDAHSFWALPESPEKWWRPSRHKTAAGRTREPVTVYAEIPPRSLRKLATFDVVPDAREVELDVFLLKGETIRPDAVRLFRSRPPAWRNPLATKDGQPGVSFRYMDVEGPIAETSWPSAGHRAIFGELPLKPGAKGAIEVVSQNPRADAERLVRAFVRRAYRRVVTDADAAPFVKLAHTALDSGGSFADAIILADSAVLCSPEFVTLKETPGPLDDHALATRLALFLWNSPPDDELRSLADKNQLRNPGVLRAQTERLLNDPKSARFVAAFTDYWLDLRKIYVVSPDERLYPDYYLDDYLLESALDETRAFFAELLRANLPAKTIVSSDFVMINEKLATHYGIPGVEGCEIRKVKLRPGSVRGGILTQASVLKVTANGTTTSPVVRGAWVTGRILGLPVPPPPAAVPAVEPDTRGATTIREQLARHRTDRSCNACHAKIDPPGFALESFDVVGGFRDRYRALGDPKIALPGRGKNGTAFEFHDGPAIDCAGNLPDGRTFDSIRTMKSLLAADDRQLARNLTRQLAVFATGAPVRFGDRPKIEAILNRAAPETYGVRSLVHALVESEMFTNK